MRVFFLCRHGEVSLGALPLLPSPGDRIRLPCPDDTHATYLVIGQRIFEQREFPLPVSVDDLALEPILPMRLEWVCLLMPEQDTR